MTVIPLDLVPDPDDPALFLPYVTAEVDGRPVPMLLDSGAARSAVSWRDGLAVHEVVRGGGGLFAAAGERVARRAPVRLRLAGHDLGTIEVDVSPPGHPGAPALLGQDVLARWCCRYRLGRGELVVDAPPLTDGVPITLDRGSHVVVDVAWAGGITGRAIVDTGAAITIVDRGFADRHPDRFESIGVTEGTDADGTVAQTPLLRMAPVSMLDSTFGASAAAAVDLSAAAVGGEAVDLILGWPLLSQGTVTVDHANRLARHDY